MSTSEAIWRLLGYRMHAEVPNIYRLAVHLPCEQTIMFTDDDQPAAVLAKNHTSTLMAWFEANKRSPAARDILYVDFPRSFVWKAKEKAWQPRKRTCGERPPIGRVYFTQPGERAPKLHCRIYRKCTISLHQQAEVHHFA